MSLSLHNLSQNAGWWFNSDFFHNDFKCGSQISIHFFKFSEVLTFELLSEIKSTLKVGSIVFYFMVGVFLSSESLALFFHFNIYHYYSYVKLYNIMTKNTSKTMNGLLSDHAFALLVVSLPWRPMYSRIQLQKSFKYKYISVILWNISYWSYYFCGFTS